MVVVVVGVMDKTEGVAWFWGELQVALFPPLFLLILIIRG